MKTKLRHLAICFLLLFWGSYIVYGQGDENQGISLKLKNESLRKAIQLIENQSSYLFVYDTKKVDVTKKVTITIINATIQDALGLLLDEKTTYSISGNNIALKQKDVTKETSGNSSKQVRGVIVDEKGDPIIGATVMIKGSTSGTITGFDGDFVMAASEGDELEISYIGYSDQSILVGSREDFRVSLSEDTEQLDDLVVIGYGQQKKSSMVSSINSIGSAELKVKQRNLRNNIAGQVAGVIAVQRSGEPGNDAAAFYIRGQSSYAGGTNPLVLVDGVPRSMDDIDVDEIESFAVLKDAAATAVYGAEGANGVVLITSKRGKIQKTEMNISAQINTIQPRRMPEVLDAYSYQKLWNEARWNDQGNPSLGMYIPEVSSDVLEKYLDADQDFYPSTNWLDLLRNFTCSQRYTASFRGGGEKVRFFVSGSYYNESGIYNSSTSEGYDANINLDRFNLRSNIDIDITNTTKLSVDLSGQYIYKNAPGFSSDDIFTHILRYPTHVIPMIYSDGSYSDHYDLGWGRENQPYNMLNNSGYTRTWSAFLQSKVVLDQKLDFITKGLSIRGAVSFDADYSSSMKRSMTPQTFYTMGVKPDGALDQTVKKEGILLGDPSISATSGVKKIYLEAQLNYNRIFADKHNVSAMALYMQKETQYQNRSGVQLLPYRKQSVVARASYNYDERYMLEASMGTTGSENFAKGFRWGVFPAIGAAWYVSHEGFMQNATNFLSKLKVRTSYGLTGNDNLGNYVRFPFNTTINFDAEGTNLGITPGANGGASNWFSSIVEGIFGVPTLTWEKESKMNVGVDLGLFNGRIDISADYFINNRLDILIQRQTIPSVAGFREKQWQNYGETTNTGFDVGMILKQHIGGVSLEARGNFTYASNIVLEKDEPLQKYDWQYETGYRINQPKLYIAERLYVEEDFNIIKKEDGSSIYELKKEMPVPSANVAPGDILYKDLNSDGVIDAYDQSYDNGMYSELPEIVYGFGLNVEYKGFFAAVFCQGVANASVNMMSNTSSMMPFNLGKDFSSAKAYTNDRWSHNDPYNHNVLYPRIHSSKFTHNELPSTWWYRDGDFLRLKNVEIGYEFDKKLLSRLKMSSLRLYLQGHNLATWDSVKYWDPELGSNGGKGVYPLSSTYSVGLEITF